MEGEKEAPFLPISRFMAEASIAKDRSQTEAQHIHVIYVSCDMAVFKMKTQRDRKFVLYA